MGPWESAVVAVAAVTGVFFAVMGFRGLIDALDNFSGHCVDCGRVAILPLSPQRHLCLRCHYRDLSHPSRRRTGQPRV
jgi:ribosomal protein S27AE